MIKTTKKHFKLFKSEVIRLVNLFGLTDWKISFEHKDLEDDYVRLSWDYSGSVACFFLCTNWDREEAVPLTNEAIKKIALHEVCHLLVAPITSLGEARFVNEGEITDENERLARQLTNILGSEI
jgi:hypothetical protein